MIGLTGKIRGERLSINEGKSQPFSWWGKRSKQVNKKEGIRGQYDGETQDKGTG